MCGCGGGPSLPTGPADALFAYSDGGVLYLVHGDGSGLKRVIGGDYEQVALSPDRTKIACVSSSDFYVTVLSLDKDQEIEGKPKNLYNSQALHASGELGHNTHPVWSPDGGRLYFLNANHLVVYDYQERHTTVLFDFPEGPLGGVEALGIDRNGGTLYCQRDGGPGKTAFWTFDLASGQGSLLLETDPTAVARFELPAALAPEAVEALFGSKEDPVREPAFSSDRRCYVYERRDVSWPAHQWLEGYDRDARRKFMAASLGWSLLPP